MNSMDDPLMTARLRVMQIIATALILGVAVFLGIVLYIVQVQNQGHGTTTPQEVPVVSLMAGGFLAVIAVVSFVVPAGIVRATLRGIAAGTGKPQRGVEVPATDAGNLLGLYQTTLIVGLATLEGACFFNVIAYLLEAQPYTLGCIGVGLLLMVVRFPTEGRVRLWLEDRKEQLARARQEIGTGGQAR